MVGTYILLLQIVIFHSSEITILIKLMNDESERGYGLALETEESNAFDWLGCFQLLTGFYRGAICVVSILHFH